MSDPVIGLLAPDHLDSAFALSSTASWNQRLADWHTLLTLAPGGCFAAFSEGRVVGTAIGVDYGGFAWIAMMLVDPAYRGRGLGRRLLEAAIASVPPDRPIRLDATPMGRPLYQACGFEDEVMLTRHVADGSTRLRTSLPHTFVFRHVRPLTPDDLPVLAPHDTAVFGGNRGAVLAWVLDGAPQYARVVESDDGPMHYCLGREGRLFESDRTGDRGRRRGRAGAGERRARRGRRPRGGARRIRCARHVYGLAACLRLSGPAAAVPDAACGSLRAVIDRPADAPAARRVRDSRS